MKKVKKNVDFYGHNIPMPRLAKVLPAGTACEFCGRKNKSWPVRRYLVAYACNTRLKRNMYANIHWGCFVERRAGEVLTVLKTSGRVVKVKL